MGANQGIINIRLKVTDDGSVVVDRFGKSIDKLDKKSGKGMQGFGRNLGSINQKLKNNIGSMMRYAGVIGGVTAAVVALKKAWDLVNLAAKARQEKRAFTNLAASYGMNADKMIRELKRVSGQTIDTMTLVRNAGTAMMMGIAPKNITRLMEIARATAKMTGQTVTKAFEDISLAVGRQSKMILDNLGIIIDVEKANKKYAESIGKTSTQLSDLEKKQAFMNATLASGEDLMARLGNQTDTVSDRIERWKARWKDAAVWVGNSILTIGMGLEALFTSIGAAVNKTISMVVGGHRRLLDLAAKLPLAGKYIKPMADGLKAIEDNSKSAADIGVKHLSETWQTMTSIWKKEEPVQQRVVQNLKAQAAAAKEMAKGLKEIITAEKESADLKRQATEEMYKSSGINAQAYYANEAQELVEKVSKWEQAGVDIRKINEYLYDQFGKMAEDAYSKGEMAAGDYMDTMQARSQVLVSDFQSMQEKAIDRLNSLDMKIKDIDGSNIGLTVSLYDQASSGIEQLIDKLQMFQNEAASAVLSGGSLSSSGANESSGGESSTNINHSSSTQNVFNFNQQFSRSDVENIVSEQNRMETRG